MSLTSEKYAAKQNQLISRTSQALNISSEKARTLLSIPRQQSVRINTLKTSLKEAEGIFVTLAVAASPVGWMPEGYFVTDGLQALRDSEYVNNGRIYIQNAASWLPVIALDPRKGDTVLDMCAAPGGKTSHIAQQTGNGAAITANDNSRPRLIKLQRNLERLGATDVAYTLHDATRLARVLPVESFDKILLDAPCSGEGMMTLSNKKDFESWSTAHIKRLQQLQKKLILQAWQLLKPGGTLVYSTCTMAPEENEAVIDYLLRKAPEAQLVSLENLRSSLSNSAPSVSEWHGRTFDARTAQTLRLIPSESVEAFFVAKVTKPR